jgi:hypothetical protein
VGREVVEDGTYGDPPRRRLRCPEDGEFHRSVPEVPRHPTDDGTCDACDTAVANHRSSYQRATSGMPGWPLAVASALVNLGAQRLRRRTVDY